MYWWYYPYYGYGYYPLLPPPDFLYLMSTLMLWMVYPYYYALYFELLRTALEAWRKAFESIYKGLGPAPS